MENRITNLDLYNTAISKLQVSGTSGVDIVCAQNTHESL